jgi:DNA-3-methyladenine glycosylase
MIPEVPLPRHFFDRDAVIVAQDVIGVTLLVHGTGGVIVEAEAYDQTDPASHCYRGRRTARNASMFGPPGHAYVYRSYGVHWCLNFVCGSQPSGGAVLIRALQPSAGTELMRQRRGAVPERKLCAGPGNLTQALAITGELDGKPLFAPPFKLLARTSHVEVVSGRRIGITRGIELPWRFGVPNSPFVSRKLGEQKNMAR